MTFHRGTTLYDPEKCFNGYTLWSPLVSAKEGADEPWQTHGVTSLITMRGDVVHSWDLPFPSFYSYLLPDGHLLAGMLTTESEPMRPGVDPHHMGGAMGMLAELDWDGKILFMHKDLSFHHDFKKLPNGNYVYLAWEPLDAGTIRRVRGGVKGSEHADGMMWSDVYREVDPSGAVVWEWHAREHLDFGRDIIGCIHTRDEWSHINDLWVCENGDIVSSCRHLDAVIRVSRATGDIIWRWGSPTYEDGDGLQLSLKNEALGGPHDAHIIPEGLPGAGHMLCYDNGMYKYLSRAVEVDTESGEIVWQSTTQFTYAQGRVPFSPYISGARRQPNGNTVICEGANGRLYEVTLEQEVVWEYWKPEAGKGLFPWSIFRCFRYGRDFCPQFASLPEPGGEAIR